MIATMTDKKSPKLTLIKKNKTKRVGLSKKIRYEVFKRDNFKCFYCGKKPSDEGVVLEVDHVLPVYEGGTNDIENLVTSCKDCNRGKGKTKLNDKNYSSLKKAEHDSVDDKIDLMKEFVKSRMNKSREIEPACQYINDILDKWKDKRQDKQTMIVTQEFKDKLLILYRKASMPDLITAIEQCEVVFLGETVESIEGMPYNDKILPSDKISNFYLYCVRLYLEKIITKKEKSSKHDIESPSSRSAYLVGIIKNRTQGHGEWEVSNDVRALISKLQTKERKLSVLNEILIPKAQQIEQDSDYTEFYNKMFDAIETNLEISKLLR